MRKEIKALWSERRVHGLELIFATALLAFRYLSLSYWLRTVLPPPDDPRHTIRDNAIDAYCVIQFIALSLVLASGFSPIIDSAIVAYILFEIYLNLLNIVFIGKFRDINAPPASVERSILVLVLNIVGVVLAFGVLYRHWLGLSKVEGLFKAVLVLGTIGYPEASGKLVLLVALQVFLDVLLFVLVIASFVGQLGLFSHGNRSQPQSTSKNVLTSVKAAFDAYYQARSEELDRQIRIAENQLALDGLGNSTAVADRFRELYRDVLRDCLSKLLTSFERTLEGHDVGPKSGLQQSMVDVIQGSLQPIASDFNQRLDRAAKNAGVPLHKNLDDEIARLQTEAKVEVDLLLGRLRLKAEAGKKWYERPIGIILLGILVAVVGGLLLALLIG